MIHRVDDRLRDEARRYRLMFACPDCASFDPGIAAGEVGALGQTGHEPRCSLGFPVAPHIETRLDEREELIFCKAFELR